MTAALIPMLVFQPMQKSSTTGQMVPIPGGKLYTYAAGTTTPLATYSDAGGATPLANPVILDANGIAQIYLGTASYKFLLTDSVGATIYPYPIDNVQPDAAATQLRNDLASTASAALGDFLVGVKSTLTGGVGTTQHEVNARTVSVKDFGTITGVEDTAMLNLAFAQVGKVIYMPAGTYRVTANLDEPKCAGIIGDGATLTLITCSSSVTALFQISATNSLDFRDMRGIGITGNATASAVGIFWGYAAALSTDVSNFVNMEDVVVEGFTGTGAVGFRVGNLVTADIKHCRFLGNTLNVLVNPVSLHQCTTVRFYGCAIRTALTLGCQVSDGSDILFRETVFESNAQQGVNIGAAAGRLLPCRFEGCWFENNWTSIAAASRPTIYYHLTAGDGTAMSGAYIQVFVKDCHFGSDATSPLVIHFNGPAVKGFYIGTPVIDSSYAVPILIENGAYGTINWNAPSGTYASQVSDPSINAARVALSYEIPFIPTLTGFTGSGTNVVTGRYSKIGSTIFGVVKIVSTGGTGIGSVANSSYIIGSPTLPGSGSANDILGTCSASNATTVASSGNGTVIYGNVGGLQGVIFTPVWANAVGTHIITFQYQIGLT